MKPTVIVIGSSNTDLVVTCRRLPKPGETLLGGEFARHAGGKGANQAVAAARAGARVVFIGAHGEDEFGAAAKRSLRAEGIDISHFRSRSRHPSGIALILLGGKARENLIAVARSANDALGADDVKAARSFFRPGAVVVAQLEVPLAAVGAAAALARERNLPFVLNPAPARKLPASLLRLVDVLVPNGREAEILTGKAEPVLAARILRERGCRSVVVTLGARGALVCDQTGERAVAAPRVKPIDTVGAGDCFTGWLAVGLAEGLTLGQAAERAVRAASISVTRPGAQASMPLRAELERKTKS